MKRSVLGFVVAVLLSSCSLATPRDSVTATGAAATPVSGAVAQRSAVATDPTDPTIPGATAATSVSGGARGVQAPTRQAAAATSAASESNGSTVGLTSDRIVISLLAGFSGPYGSLFKTWADNAFGLWAAEINDRGGIHGRKLVLKQVDNRDTAEGGVAACKEAQSNGSFMAISMAGLGGADMSSSDCLDKAGVPVVAFNLAGYRDNWRYVISVNDDAKQAVPIASFIKSVMGDGAGKTGMIVVNDPIQFAARDAIRRELDRLKIAHVNDETISAGQGSFVAELSRLRNAGATTVVMVTGSESIGIVRDAKAMGYAPNFTGMFWTLDEFSQAAGQVWNGIKAVRVFPTTESREYAAYKEKAKHYGYDSVDGTTVMAYYGGGVLISDILTKAGRSLGRDAVPRTTKQLGDYSNGILAVSFAGSLVADVKDFPIVCCNADNTWKGLGEPRLSF